ncbi:OLC1v1033877C1 [Oldenlandia corymbosa var. corymbosa]|uniref:Protein RRP5 homolog n=1 Tax=Oldenlandia corymbosa var. corymbosa TaxID=529605 RepID=A0AAV1CPZ3_OLDCO|nr:OLC1v1033877C1 [Oldenlandia corymbosa var. corymbosa]
MAPPSKKSPSAKPSKPSALKPSKKPFKKSKPNNNGGGGGGGRSNKGNMSDDPKDSRALELVEDDVPDFPRGGRSSLSRRELGDLRAEVDAEFEAEQRLKNKGKRKQKMERRSKSEEDDLGSLFGDAFTGKLPKFANRITLKNISPGMKLWGVISEVNEKDLVVSLPGGLRGLVRASEAFDPLPADGTKKGDLESNFLSSMYHVGQLVSCIVQQLEDDKKESGKRRIWLSLRLSLLHKGYTLEVVQEGMVLTGYVKSIEDHGYILDFGLASFTGFMPKINKSESKGTEVKVGQLIQGAVKRIDKTRKLLYMSSDQDLVSRSLTKDLKGFSIDLLIPGMLVEARVRSSLENGVMLSFLTYFTGTVDIFNFSETFPTSKWEDHYAPNKKVIARILFIDPSTRAVGLTMNPHLVHNTAPPTLVQAGEIFDQSKIIRIDKDFGLLLEVPSSPAPTPAYVSVSDVADKEVKKLEKNFREGSLVRVRILGFRHLEGLATGILKTSAFEGSVFTHSDVKPGMIVKAKVIAVNSFGAIVQLGSGVKALCPLRHMSELEIAKPRKKFQVGAELVFRVLGSKSKRITVTQKKTLVKSKLEIISSYADASEGLMTHGWITKIESHGCFVRFYNGVQGFAPRSELGLDPGYDLSSMYHVEQVVKCRVTSSNPAMRRITLSFTAKPARIAEDEAIHLGSLVSGVVERVTPQMVVVSLASKSHIKGSISPEHLSDHQGLAATMKSLLKPGYQFDKLLVLDIEGSNLILSAKHSLIKHASDLPSDISQVRLHSVVHGYVCNLIETGCFVRFVGRLTGFAPKNKAIDDKTLDLSEAFFIGQSVRSNIVDVNSETNRISLSLKQSVCSSTDASFIQEYFLSEEKIVKLQLDSESGDLSWVDEFAIGSVVKGEVSEIKDYGVVISFTKYKDIVGFISQYHLNGITVELGATVQAAVLDVSKTERLLDLSLKPEFCSNAPTQNKKRRRESHSGLDANQIVRTQVEIVKEDYLVLSIPTQNYALGYASIADYNTQRLPHKQFVSGQSVTATVAALPDSSTGEKLLLLVKSINQAGESSSLKRTKRNASFDVGSIVQGEVTEIKPLELRLKFGSGLHGRVHITEASDDNNDENPFSGFRVGQMVTARIVSNCNRNRNYPWELSLKPSKLSGSSELEEGLLVDDYEIGANVSGFVYKVDKDWAWLTVSRDVNAQLYILDSACEPAELEDFQKRFCVGKFLSGYVMKVDKERKLLRLVLLPLPVNTDKNLSITNGSSSSTSHLIENKASHISEGSIVGGKISKILPGVGGVLIQIDQHLYGKVHFTELTEPWVSNPLSGYHEGQFVKCKVLEISHSMSGALYVDLSLRLTLDGNSPFGARGEKIEDLKPDMVVKGYVKNVTPRGCFIMISRKFDAKILLSNLSDGYIENPQTEFPVGTLVTGRVLSVEPLSKRVEVTLKTSNVVNDSKSDINALDNIAIGDVLSGRIKRIESYGFFVSIDHTNLVGLCHVSELSDDHIDNIEAKYKTGERVTAKVLKVDKDKSRISLGMKSSYFKSDTNDQKLSEQGPGDAVPENHHVFEDTELMLLPEIADFSFPSVNGTHVAHDELESRASIRPLEVPLDDIEDSDTDNVATQVVELVDDADTIDEKSRKRPKKKAKLEREQEIEAAENRLKEKKEPENADDFEKLIRSSPNSSFAWMKYMSHMLKLADVEKARAIAERALRTINIREESEKLNIWVAYFNLESKYGNPPEEAVVKLFHRALQYCDPKKLHMALLGVYERNGQQKLADELLGKMIKKFKQSRHVWLERVKRVLQQNHDELDKNVTRALLCLPQHKRIRFISDTAIHAFKSGFPDKGRTLFEGMLREYPSRIDLWNIYLDQEIILGEVDVIRSLFDRATSLSLKPRKIKSLFGKYLDYESNRDNAEPERIRYVKDKAMEYAKSLQA